MEAGREGGGQRKERRAVKGGKGRKAAGGSTVRGRKGRRGRERRSKSHDVSTLRSRGSWLYNMRHFLLLQWF